MTTPLEWSNPLPGLRILRRGDVPVRRVQVYGQRCSGTNVLSRTIEANAPDLAMTYDFGFKHWFVPRQAVFAKDVLVLVVARDAFDWVRSLYRQPWHAHPDLKAKPFADFIRSEWYSIWDEHIEHIETGHPMFGAEMLHERDPETGARFANCIAKRTAKLRHWTMLWGRAHNVALIGYDAFAADPQAYVEQVTASMEIDRPSCFRPVSSYKGGGHFPYTPVRYPELAPDDAAHIEAWLDPELEAAFGLASRYAGRGEPRP